MKIDTNKSTWNVSGNRSSRWDVAKLKWNADEIADEHGW